MPPKKNKGGKGKTDDWDDDAAEKKLAAKLTVKDEVEETAFSESEEEARPAPKAKNRMAAFQMLSESENDSDAKQSDDEVPAKEKSPVKAEPKKEKKEKNKKKDKKKEKKEEDDLDELLANFDKKEEKVGKKAKKKEKQAAAAAGDDDEKDAEADASPEPTAAPAADAPEGEKADDDGKKKKKKKKKGGKGDDEGEDEKKDAENEEKEEEEAEKPESELTEEEKKKLEKKRKEKEKKKEKERKEKEKKEKGGKKGGDKHVDMIKEMLRAKQEAEEAEAKRIKEEEERFEALMKAQEEEERIRKEQKEAEKKRKQDRIEAEKKAGTYLTPAQRAKQAQTMARLAAANIQMPRDDETASADGEKPKKRILYDTKKKGGKKDTTAKESKPDEKEKSESPAESKPATPVPVEQPVAAAPAAPAAPAPAEEEEAAWDAEPVDDWEMAEVIPVLPPAAPAAATSAAPAAPAADSKVAAAAVKQQKSADSKEESESSSDESSSDEDSSSEDDSSSEEESSSDEDEKKGGKKETKEQMVERVKLRLKKRREVAQSKRSTDNLRAPVICVLGHVDTGKTKMLDTIRRTNVQDGEAGGITQQIGATQVPGDAIKERCKMVRDFNPDQMKIPGFLIIDTPGHESFSNLRNRGSSLCDYAILVVDIMHGLEPQTIESLKLLLKRETPFVIALNKIDRLYGYESNPRKDVYQHLKSQPQNTQMEFQERYNKIVGEFSEQGVNVVLSNKNRNEAEYISMVPTSAMQGDGIGNIMAHIALTTQTRFADKLAFCEELDATVMEVKAIAGLGTTIDVILVNGTLNVGDIIVLTGSDGAITTPVRELLMPAPLKEMRVKNEYEHFKQIRGAQGIKILAKGLEKALAGLPMYVAHKEDEVDILREEAESQLRKALVSIKRKPEGVYVQASTLGSLEALLEFLKSQKIPYSNVNIGPVHKRDVQKAAVMMEHNPEFACILAFDVRVEKDAQLFADHEGVKIFQADIIYHLEDNFLKYREELRLKARAENEHRAIFPCKLRVLPQHVFNARNPIVCGVAIEAGQLKKGTPICVPSKEGILLGAVSSIERNHEQVDLAKAGEEVCIKIENTTGEAPKLYGRHFTHEDALVSKITRDSIDVCKEYFRDDLTKGDWGLVVQLKKLLDIM